MEEVKNERIEGRKKQNKLLYLIALFYMIIILFITILYIYGGIIYRGYILNPVYFINLIIQIFNSTRFQMYNTISGTIMAVIYVIFLVKILKVAIVTIDKFTVIRKLKIVDKVKVIEKMSNAIGKVLGDSFSVMIISYLIFPYRLNIGSIILIILGILFYLLKELTILLISYKKIVIKNVLIDMLGKVIIVAFIVVLTLEIMKPSLYDLSHNSMTFFQMFKYRNTAFNTRIYFIYHYGIRDLLSVSLIFQYITLVQKILGSENYKYSKIRTLVYCMVIFSFVYLLLENFMEAHLLIGNVVFTLEVLDDWIKNSLNTHMSIIFTLGAGLVIMYSPLYYRHNNVLRYDEE